MPTDSDYLQKARYNLAFLVSINNHLRKYTDWMVTVAFYSALHLVNSHLKSTTGRHFNSHASVDNAINPNRASDETAFDQVTYRSYQKLRQLARRSRYLYHEGNREGVPFTGEKHLSKAIYHLDIIMTFIDNKYGVGFEERILDCERIRKMELNYFRDREE